MIWIYIFPPSFVPQGEFLVRINWYMNIREVFNGFLVSPIGKNQFFIPFGGFWNIDSRVQGTTSKGLKHEKMFYVMTRSP